ncbi:MAG: DNA polymerase IV, partial [SAR202 cluster bacterium]|nr:DNA polymerase IV [SAR202 cluster bacterium]
YRLCPHARYIPGRFDHYIAVSTRFLGILGEYTPFMQSMGLDEAYLDMTGFESLYGPLEGIAGVMKRRVREELRVTASVGIATSRVVAKVASDACKPDGLLRVAQGEEAAFLAPRPIRELPGIGEKTEPLLKGHGYTTIGDLARTPPIILRRILGSWGDVVWRSSQGLDDTAVAAAGDPKSVSRVTTFREDTLDPALIRGTLRYLGERVCAELRSHDMTARAAVLHLRWHDFTTITRHRTFPGEVSSDEAVYRAVEEMLSRELQVEAQRKRRKVRLIGVGVEGLAKDNGQLALLGDAPDERLAKAVDAIRGKYGFVAVQKGLTLHLNEAVPEGRGKFVLRTRSPSR